MTFRTVFRFSFCLTVGFLLSGVTGVARADIPVELCNRTDLPAKCVVALDRNGTIEVSGRHKVEPGQCRSFVSDEGEAFFNCVQLQFDEEANKWLESGNWNGERTFCVPQFKDEFRLAQPERITGDCEAHGYTSVGFETQEMSGEGEIEISLE